MQPRRFPPPWTVVEKASCFVVEDDSGQVLGWFYFEEARGGRKEVLTKDEARRVAEGFAKLPELIGTAATGA
jgi:hypothetical protein